MNSTLVTAYFVGVLTAERPIGFEEALKELTKTEELEDVDAKAVWKKCESNLKKERQGMLKTKGGDLAAEAAYLAEIGDYFLMGMAVSGTDVEDMENEDVSELLVEMEDHLLLLDEWMAEGEDGKPSADWKEDGQKYKREYLEIWQELEEALA